MTSSNECLKSLPVCGGCETPPRAWGISQLGYDDRPKNRLKRCVVHAMCAQSSQRIQSLRDGVYYCLSATDRWLVKVIPSILITETRATFSIGCGSCTVVLRFLSMKTISAYLVGLTLRLLTRDHDSTLINSDCLLLALTAGMMMFHQQTSPFGYLAWLVSGIRCWLRMMVVLY